MKKLIITALLTVFVAVAGVASAQDMAKVTCSEFMKASDQEKTMLVFWMDGYMSAMSENTEMSDEWIEKFGMHLGSYCTKNGSHTIMQAMEATPE